MNYKQGGGGGVIRVQEGFPSGTRMRKKVLKRGNSCRRMGQVERKKVLRKKPREFRQGEGGKIKGKYFPSTPERDRRGGTIKRKPTTQRVELGTRETKLCPRRGGEGGKPGAQ